MFSSLEEKANKILTENYDSEPCTISLYGRKGDEIKESAKLYILIIAIRDGETDLERTG